MTDSTGSRPYPSSRPGVEDTLAPVRRRIDDLRRLMRRRFLIDGLLYLAVTVLGLAVLSFVFDRMLELPVGVRAVFIGVSLVIVAVTAYRRVIRPLSVHLSDEDLALAIEARRPDLKDRVISALQFARQIEDPENEESPELILALLDETADLARNQRFDRIVSAKSLGLVTAVLLGLVVVSGATVIMRSDLVGIWAQRALLADVPWPRDTTLVVIDILPGEDHALALTRGDDLTVIVEARGEVPDDVRITYRARDEEGLEDSRRMYRLPDTENRFQFEFREIPRNFAFTVRGGDDDDDEPVYFVDARIPPTVESIAAHCTYPAYTNLQPDKLTQGDLEVPAGTKIDFVITVNPHVAVTNARFVREGAEGAEMAPGDDHQYRISFTVEQSFEYSLRLLGEDDLTNRIENDTFRITAVADRRPEVRVLTPSPREVLSPGALMPLKVLATDNYGVDTLRLTYRRRGPDKTDQERPVANATPPGGREVVAFEPIEISTFRGQDGRTPQEGDVLVLHVIGRDNNGLEDSTEEIHVEIALPEDIERRLGQRQVALKEDATSAETLQKDARKALQILRPDATSGQPLDRTAIDRLRDIQIIQGRVGRKMEEFLAGIRRVLNGYVFNRLGNPVAGQAILTIYLEHLARDREYLSRVYKPALYAEVVAAFRRGEIFDPEVLGILIQILEIGGEIADTHSPRAHKIISDLVRGDIEDPAAALKDVEEIQAACLARFTTLMKMMRRWETYHEFIVRMRDLEELQRQITNRARKALEGQPK
jgi:Domain of unknown function (DUF4175)